MLLTRRTLFQNTAALALLGALPFEFAFAGVRTSAAPWSQKALAKARPIAEPLVRHPFVQGLASGRLPRETALAYLVQNLPYLINYAECFEILEKRLEDEADKALARRWAKETHEALAWTKTLCTDLAGGKVPYTEPVIATANVKGYMQLERSSAEDRSPTVAMAALLPCFWVYMVFGQGISKSIVREKNPYAEWVSFYGSKDYAANVQSAVALADKLAARAGEADRSRALEVFLKGCRFEKALFDEAVAFGKV